VAVFEPGWESRGSRSDVNAAGPETFRHKWATRGCRSDVGSHGLSRCGRWSRCLGDQLGCWPLIEEFNIALRASGWTLIKKFDILSRLTFFYWGRCFVQRFDVFVCILAYLLDGRLIVLLHPPHDRTQLMLTQR
jgi:hypothetical protein